MSRSHFEAFKGGVDSRMALRCTGAVGRSKDAVSGLSEVGLEVVRLQRRGLGGVLGAIATKSGRKSGGGALPTGLGRSRRGQGHQLRSWRWAALLWFARPGGGEGLAGRVLGGRGAEHRWAATHLVDARDQGAMAPATAGAGRQGPGLARLAPALPVGREAVATMALARHQQAKRQFLTKEVF